MFISHCAVVERAKNALFLITLRVLCGGKNKNTFPNDIYCTFYAVIVSEQSSGLCEGDPKEKLSAPCLV